MTGAELEAACARAGVDVRGGDALVVLPRLGMPLIDAADPTELAAACAEEGRATFLFVAAPPRLGAASGVPVNPLAILRVGRAPTRATPSRRGGPAVTPAASGPFALNISPGTGDKHHRPFGKRISDNSERTVVLRRG